MKQFKEYIKETSGTVTLTFGHFNPPNVEHEKLIQKVTEVAEGGVYRIFTSQECNENYPLDYDTKIKFMRKMFPRQARSIISDSKIDDLYSALQKLYEQGYRKVNLVMPNIPSQLTESVNKENKVTYNFESINFISVDCHDSVETKLVEAAKNNNFELFTKHLPTSTVVVKEGHKLFNAIRSGLGLKESYNFRQHIQLPKLSEEREAYISGELFKVGDVVEVKESKEIGQIKRLGSNYVIIETYEGQTQRKWLKDITKIEEAFVNKMLDQIEWIDESAAAGLADKAKKSGVSLSVLKKVYARGVAAWNSGHRPGTTPQQWGMARVNSYITKGKGTYHGADKDLREGGEPGEFNVNDIEEACWSTHVQKGMKKKGDRMVPNCVPKESVAEDSRLDKKAYHKGLSDKTAQARVAHWKKMDKLSDNDPRAYEPAPGDATAKTKESEHTKKYRRMYGEQLVTFKERLSTFDGKNK